MEVLVAEWYQRKFKGLVRIGHPGKVTRSGVIPWGGKFGLG